MAQATEIELDGQYRALREAAGALVRERRTIVAAGAEAAEYLQGQLTNDVEALEPGQGCYAALLDRKGRIQADLRVLRFADRLALDTEPAAAEAVVRHLSFYKVGREVTIDDRTAELAVISIIGPAAAELAIAGPAGPEHAHREVEIGSLSATVVATDAGVDLLIAAADVEAAGDVLRARGIEAVSEAAAEIVRVESGRPRFGHEISAQTMPAEAGIEERAVSFTKGCYIGQETVARLHYKGRPNRRLRGLRLDAPATAGDSIRLGERDVGAIGSAVVSPARGPIALAIIRREAEPGARLEVGEGNGAEVVELPF